MQQSRASTMPITNPVTLLRSALQVMAFNVLIAVSITVFEGQGLGINLVYSQCIGMLIWLLVAGAQTWWVRDYSRHWQRLVAIVPVAVVLAYVLGSLLADALLHVDTGAHLASEPRKVVGLLVMSLCAGAVVTYFFLSRAQLAAERQRAEVAQRLAAESRLKLLESQLEPHMLFNTLANLRALIAVDPARAQTMLDHLISYLRATLSASRVSTHTLEQAFALLHDYLELMAVRMGPRLQFRLTLPDALCAVAVPALLLQPLVENSIQHGLEPKVEGGVVDISAAQGSGFLILQVTDNGLGLAPPSSEASDRGFGLSHVRERLATVYGSAASLTFTPNPAGGTCATIVVPLQS